MNKRAFTLVELLAVLVILAIIFSIAIPIVLKIIDDSNQSSYKRSVDLYGKAIENALADYYIKSDNKDIDLEGNYNYIDNTTIGKEGIELNIDYKGTKVECGEIYVKENKSLFLSKCKVNNKSVKDKNTNDKYYHYGTKEFAVQDNYEAYNIGDEVTYNNIKFFVIEEDSADKEYLVLMKDKPLTKYEVDLYGQGGYVNRSSSTSQGEAIDYNGYGVAAYTGGDNCGYNSEGTYITVCDTNFDRSDIKHIIDTWASDKLFMDDLIEVENYKVRLLKITEAKETFNCTTSNGSCNALIYKSSFAYWTMSPIGSSVWGVTSSGSIYNSYWESYGNYSRVKPTVRPVINLKKSAINLSD